MDKYISWKDLWCPIRDVEFYKGDPSTTMISLINMLLNGHGTYDIRENKIIFYAKYNLLDRKWSTSVIGSDHEKYQTEKDTRLLDNIHEEKECIKWILDHINEMFIDYDDLYLNVFFNRYFLNSDIESIINKFSLYKNRYYEIIRTGENLVKRGLLLSSPPQELIDMIG